MIIYLIITGCLLLFLILILLADKLIPQTFGEWLFLLVMVALWPLLIVSTILTLIVIITIFSITVGFFISMGFVNTFLKRNK